MKARASHTARSTVRARGTIDVSLHEDDFAPMSDEQFDKAMRALLAVRWNAREWKDRRRKKRKR